PPQSPPYTLSLHDALPILPHWHTATKAAPGSGMPSNLGTMSRCALLLIGRNSVTPWTIPRRTASQTGMHYSLLSRVKRASRDDRDRKSTRLNSSHEWISYA